MAAEAFLISAPKTAARPHTSKISFPLHPESGILPPQDESCPFLILLTPQHFLIEVAPLQWFTACQGLQPGEDLFEGQLKRQLKRQLKGVSMDSAIAQVFKTMLQPGW